MDHISVDVQLGDGLAPQVDMADLERVVRWALDAQQVERAELSIALVSDTQIEQLNRQHLDHEGPTDVISFQLGIPGGPIVGDVYIGAEQAQRQAADLGIAPREELLRLIIHGTLHVLGFEHPESADHRAGSPMYERQEELLSSYLRAHP